jgi:hypothetical protein
VNEWGGFAGTRLVLELIQHQDTRGREVKAQAESHLYLIQSGQGYFDAGMTADGRQVFVGLNCPDIVALFFDFSGNLVNHESRRLEFLQHSGAFVDGDPIERMVGVYDILDMRILPRIAAWQEELGLRPATIRVKRVFLDGLGIGIEDYPDHFGETQDDPDASDEEKADIFESIGLWDAEEQFVLFWGSDYWLNGSGEVVSS